MKRDPDEQKMHQTQLVVWLTGGGLVTCAWFWSGAAVALSVALGSIIAGLNLFVLARSVRNLLAGQSASWAVIAACKFLVLLGVTYLALSHDRVSALGFALGIAALPIGICVSTLFLNAEPSPAETDHA